MPVSAISDIASNINWSVWAFLSAGTLLMIGPAVYMGVVGKNQNDGEDIVDENRALQNAQKAMQITEQKLRTIIAATTEGFWMADPETEITIDVNDALCHMLGYTKEEIIGKTLLSFADTKNQMLIRHRRETAAQSAHSNYEATLKTRSGADLHVRINPTMVTAKPNGGKATMSFAFVSDISERKRHEDELYRQANYDPTTGAPNRHFLLKHIEALIGANETFSLLLIDMDNFKLYNDTFGHSYGDVLLKKITERLKDKLNDTDFLAHLGGDEFVIVSRQKPAGTATYAKRLLKKFTDHPIVTARNELYVGVSIGVSSYPSDGSDADQLMRSADLAMYNSKNHGKGQISVYNKSLDQDLLEKLGLGNKLRTALQNNEFSIFYQPQVSSHTGDILGVEALLRWNNSDLGNVSPARFIPVLEETGLIVPVGEWVLKTACTQVAEWHANGNNLRLSVNLSPRQFQETELASMVSRIVAETTMDPTLLMLEITESLLIGNISQMVKRLETITDLGVSFSIDDFGTGYSSLSYLQKLPIKEVKIDQAFVRNLSKNHGDMVIVKTIVAMANSFGMETVAEGVEDHSQLQALKEIGATMIQGYLTGRPMPAEEMTALLSQKEAA